MKNAHTKRSTPLYQQLQASAAKTILTKISDEKILIKRYYSSGRLKFETSLHEMPDELRGRENGAEVTMKEYVTKHYNRDGKASWWLDNGHKVREESWKNGRRVGEIKKKIDWAAKTVITKMSEEKILIERYYSNDKLKYKAHLKEMPSELRNKANGTQITPKDFCTICGSKHGLVSWWFENGQKSQEINYKNGRQDGRQTWWFEDGQTRFKGNYKDEKRDGRQTWWYNNGQMRKEEHYKDGKLNGAWTLWFDNGQMKTEGHRKDDRLDGKVTTWFKDGRIKSEKHYKEGEQCE